MKRTGFQVKPRKPLKRGVWNRKRPRATPVQRPRLNVNGRKQQESVSSLKKALDARFSLFIRNRDGGRCFTCGVVKPIKEMQNGHYISRSHNNTRYDEQNNNCQCVSCNVFKNGNMDIYAIKLMEKYGNGILDELQRRKNVIKQFSKPELQQLLEKYA